MELRTVGYFLAVVDAGTVTAAADLVHVTQPALSRQLRQLERELGVDLFERSAGRLRLSPAGAQLVPFARELMSRAEALRVAAGLQARGGLSEVTIAAQSTTLTDVVAPFITTLTPGDPLPAVRQTSGLDAAEELERGADLVITSRRPRPPLERLLLTVVPVWAYVPAGHEWAGRDEVDLAEVFDQDVVTVPARFNARRVVEVAADRLELSPRSLTEVGNGTIAQALAAAGRGVALVSDDARFDLHGVRLAAGGEPVTISLHAVWDPRHPGRDTVAALAERLREFATRIYGRGQPGDANARRARTRPSASAR